ncbi:MAG: hypothetical protein ACI4JW_03660 [Oscillospiraceae bacterium]
MYNYQMKRLFVKLWYFLAAAVILIAASKAFTVKFAYPQSGCDEKSLAKLDELCAETADMEPDSRLRYVVNWRREYTEEYMKHGEADKKLRAEFEINEGARTVYENQLRNCTYTLEGIKNYIAKGEGFVSAGYPRDLAQNPEAYRYLSTPDSINEIYFLRFLALQSFNICPFIVLLLVGIFVADSYEKRIDLQIAISAKSRSFYKSRETTLCIFILALELINLITDLAVSGMLSHPEYFGAPIQSVSNYVFFPANLTLGGAATLIFAFELLGGFVGYNIFILAAQHIRSIRNYIIITSAIAAVFTVVPKFFPSAAIYCFMGMNSKTSVLISVKYISAIGATQIFPALMILVISLTGICTWRFFGYKE